MIHRKNILSFSLFVFISIFPFSFLFASSDGEFKIRSNYQFQNISFTSDAHGGDLLFSYNLPKKWGFHGGVDYIDKFGDAAPGFRLGGTYWWTSSTFTSLEGAWAPYQVVIPRQDYLFEVGQILFKKLVPSLGYRFVDYKDDNTHMVIPTLTWYFHPRFIFTGKYFFSYLQLNTKNTVNHATMTKLSWRPWDPFQVFAGYAWGEESFESSNPVNPLGSFSAHHVLAGYSWEIYKGFGIDSSFDHEWRSNGTFLNTVNVALFYRW